MKLKLLRLINRLWVHNYSNDQTKIYYYSVGYSIEYKYITFKSKGIQVRLSYGIGDTLITWFPKITLLVQSSGKRVVLGITFLELNPFKIILD